MAAASRPGAGTNPGPLAAADRRGRRWGHREGEGEAGEANGLGSVEAGVVAAAWHCPTRRSWVAAGRDGVGAAAGAGAAAGV